MAFRQGAFRQLQHERNEREQLLHRILRDVALEGLDLLAVLLDDFGMRSRKLWDELEDIVHLDIVS